jgi:hypothetical protein
VDAEMSCIAPGSPSDENCLESDSRIAGRASRLYLEPSIPQSYMPQMLVLTHPLESKCDGSTGRMSGGTAASFIEQERRDQPKGFAFFIWRSGRNTSKTPLFNGGQKQNLHYSFHYSAFVSKVFFIQ